MVHHQHKKTIAAYKYPALAPCPTLRRKKADDHSFSAASAGTFNYRGYTASERVLSKLPPGNDIKQQRITPPHYPSDPESTPLQPGHFDESLHQTTRPIDPGFLLSLTVRRHAGSARLRQLAQH